MQERKIEVLALSKSHRTGQGVTKIGSYIILYSGTPSMQVHGIIDYLNYATGIGIHPRTPVTMCVVFFRFYGDTISGYTCSVVRLFGL